MGNDCRLFCMDCNKDLCIGRANNYNKEAMNKKLKENTLNKLKVCLKRFNMSLEKIEMFGEVRTTNFYLWFENELSFLEKHKEHNIWLIDDYYDDNFIRENSKKSK